MVTEFLMEPRVVDLDYQGTDYLMVLDNYEQREKISDNYW